MQDDHAHSPKSSPDVASDNNAPSSPEKQPSPRKEWIRFSDERRFGSIAGSDFRIWGE
jgi:hypothetical protein